MTKPYLQKSLSLKLEVMEVCCYLFLEEGLNWSANLFVKFLNFERFVLLIVVVPKCCTIVKELLLMVVVEMLSCHRSRTSARVRKTYCIYQALHPYPGPIILSTQNISSRLYQRHPNYDNNTRCLAYWQIGRLLWSKLWSEILLQWL